MNNQKSRLAIIIPCYNEELVIKSTVEVLLEVLNKIQAKGKITEDSYIYLIDDGSKDSTWSVIESLHNEHGEKIKGTKFIRNYGNQMAITAGLESVREIGCDAVISIDADLQQDENAIETFINEFHKGADVVSGIRKDRKTDSFLKKHTAYCFYRLMNLLGVKIPPNHSDYRLVSRKGLEILSQYPERNLFLRSFFHEVGLKTAYVKFDVKPRKLGKSKFTFFSLMSLALNGITSFSIVTLRIVTFIGFITIVGSILLSLEVLYEKFFLETTPGWPTIVLLESFFGGLQIFCLGIIGEYIGQIYSEVKYRPRYIKETEIK